MNTMRDVIDAFGYRRLAELIGRPVGTVSAWRTREMLPSEFWAEVAMHAESEGIKGISVERLAQIEAQAKGRFNLCPSPPHPPEAAPASSALAAGGALSQGEAA